MASDSLRMVASSLLKLDDKMVVVCVPSSSEATKLVDLIEQIGHINLREESFENILILTQQTNLHNSARQLNLDALSIVLSSVSLFWKQCLNEGIKSLENYQAPYEYQLKKGESVLFVEFFKKNIYSAFKYVQFCFAFIQRLPEGTFSGIGVDDIEQLMDHVRDIKTCLTKDIDNTTLSVVLGICPPPKKIPVDYCDGVAAVDDLLSKSKIVICTASSCSQMSTILSQLNQSDAHAIDLVLLDDALMIQSSDIETILNFSGLKLQIGLAKDPKGDADGGSRSW